MIDPLNELSIRSLFENSADLAILQLVSFAPLNQVDGTDYHFIKLVINIDGHVQLKLELLNLRTQVRVLNREIILGHKFGNVFANQTVQKWFLELRRRHVLHGLDTLNVALTHELIEGI